MARLSELSTAEFAAVADSSAVITPFPPPPVAMGLRVASGVTLGTFASYCGCSSKSLERAERGVFHEPRSVDKRRYAKALGACESWLAEHKPGTAGDIYNLWREMLDRAQNRKIG